MQRTALPPLMLVVMQSAESEADFACPNCGSQDFVDDWKPPSYVINCAKCSWSVATTRFPPIFEDERVYRVYLVPEGSDTLRAINLIKMVLGKTTAEAKRLLQGGEVHLFDREAPRLVGYLQEWSSRGVNLRTDPPFPYTTDDLMGMQIA